MLQFKKYILAIVIAGSGLTSCEKNEIGFTKDQKPAIAVVVSNAADFRAEPTVTSSLAGGGNIQIVLTTSPGRTIKEVKLATSTTYTAIQSTGTTGFYTGSPFTVNASTFTFNTTIAQYFVVNPLNATSNPAATANIELARRFYFAITLDDGTVLISPGVRVLVLT